ncbi:MAG TPA: CHAD domain-containing protein [Sphingomicrobium sp.]|jgi:CHAD domain-containing protein|nr:CHAD domain-containing protein [Sphingomicrobium sp.]
MIERNEQANWLIGGRGPGKTTIDSVNAGSRQGKRTASAQPPEIAVRGETGLARALDGHRLDREQKAREPRIGEELTVGQAFATTVQECVRHFRFNQPLIIAERDPEALHQARVALRRLRTAFALFRPVIHRGSLTELKSELRHFLRPFGTARNLDVFLASHGEDLGWSDRRKLDTARSESYRQVVEALKSQRTREMMVDLVAWTVSGDWQKAGAGCPIGKFAARRLDRAWKKVRAGGSHLHDLEEKQLHRLRIDIKELRYSVEFLAPLYRTKKVGKFAASLEAMQECLGLIHDDMVSRQIMADHDLAPAKPFDVATCSPQLKELGKRFRRLKKRGPYWR